jgi:Holliday junction resolvasome RuvABC endonuclease subunit
MPKVAGLDLSLNGTAAVVLNADGSPAAIMAYSKRRQDVLNINHHQAGDGVWRRVHPAISVESPADDFFRTSSVANCVIDTLNIHLPTGSVIGIEDHAFAAQGVSMYQLGHLHGMIRKDIAATLACKFMLIGVTEAKCAMTGSGKAEKKDMINATPEFMRLDMFSEDTRHNVADAYAIARITQCILAFRSGEMTMEQIPPTIARMMLPSKDRVGLLSKQSIGML